MEQGDERQKLPMFILEAVKHEMELFYDEEIVALKKRLDEQRERIIASAVLSIEQYVRIQTMTNELVITIRKEDKSK